MIRIGLVGLDSTHAVAFTELLNRGSGRSAVVLATPGLPTDFPLSVKRHADIAREVTGRLSVPLAGSIEELVAKVDAVMILSADGRYHLPEAERVLPAGKPVFIDKPLAASAAEGAKIVQLAERTGTPCFSASALRFSPEIVALRAAARPASTEVVAQGPAGTEPFHPTLSWYGIHTVEALYTVMGSGCGHVTHRSTPEAEIAVGVWAGGRTGQVECRRTGPGEFRVTLTHPHTRLTGQGFTYATLVAAIETFFATGNPPVPAAETLEILRFIDATELSKTQGGITIPLDR